MDQLFELLERPELESPVLILALDGWIDAGLGASTALSTIFETTTTTTVATFDTDTLLDHRARRPTAHLLDGINTGLTWPDLELRAGNDKNDKDVLFLTGAEPDHYWRAFSRAVVDLATQFGTRLVVGLGAYPAPTPHTRPTQVVATATERELADAVGFIHGQLDVPAGVHAAIERTCADNGLPAVGIWAQVPHYTTAMPYPAASLALIEALPKTAGLTFDTLGLSTEMISTRERLDSLIANSEEHLAMVQQLEEHVDTVSEAESEGLISGEDIAAEFEKYLREQGL